MKKLTSILLVALLLLNVLGYYGVFVGLQYQNSRQQAQRFDAGQYDKSETFTIKVPLTVPYATDQKDFERVDGEFEHQGEFYRMVKQRLSQDTLYIVCVKDHQGKRISQALKDYVKTFSDKPADAKSHTKTISTLIKDYIPTSYSIDHSSEGWSAVVAIQSRPQEFVNSYFVSIVHPPERG